MKKQSLKKPKKTSLKERLYFKLVFPLFNIHIQKLRIKNIREWYLEDWLKATIIFMMISLISWFGVRIIGLVQLFYLIGTISLILALVSLYMVIKHINDYGDY